MRCLSRFLNAAIPAAAGLVLTAALSARTADTTATTPPAVTSTAAATATRPAAWAQPVPAQHLKNFYKLNDRVYRSAQPEAEGMKEAAALGIREILNLRDYHDDKDEAAGAGLILHQVDLSAHNLNDQDLARALRSIRDAKGPILIHCQHGADRTGAVCALYRVVYDDWTMDAALEELAKGDYGFHAIWINIPNHLRKMDIKKFKAAIDAGRKP